MLEFPEMREMVVDAVRTFSDIEYQQKMWVDERYQDPNLIEDLDQNLSALYDFTSVAECPHDYIGAVLVDIDEAEAMEALHIAIEEFLGSVDGSLEDAVLIAMPNWRKVVDQAQATLRVLTRER
ncbi:SCO4402 family protein [Actinomadura spongiicola]